MNAPLVSIVIPAFNAEKYIAQTIQGVIEQTFQNFEIIVVDDGSADKTASIASNFGEKVQCIQTPNRGVSSARNTGIEHAVGEYIAFLDADDLWDSRKLEVQVAFLTENDDIGLCFVGTESVDADLKFISYIPAENYPDFCEALLLYSCVISGSCSSVMIRRDLLKLSGGFDTELTNYEDWDLWLRLSLLAKFAPLSDYLVKYRAVEGGASLNDPAVLEKNVIASLDKFFKTPHLPDKYRKLKVQAYSNNLLILSGEYLHAKLYYHSIRCLIRAIRLFPVNIRRPARLLAQLPHRIKNKYL